MSVRDLHEYEALLAQWADLETGLATVLEHPTQAAQFAQRLVQYDQWMQSLIQRDSDLGLYLLFQLASNSPVGYSAAHALVCGVLCHLIAIELKTPTAQRNSLVRAAFSMNLSMTALQNTLAVQNHPPTGKQKNAIRAHPGKSVDLLLALGVQDQDWLTIVSKHHHRGVDQGRFENLSSTSQLARILKVVDRYAARISPRALRKGQSATYSAHFFLGDRGAISGLGGKGNSTQTKGLPGNDPIGNALLRAVGLYPPGTYTKLDNQTLAVVVRRSHLINEPDVAIVALTESIPLSKPELHSTWKGPPQIRMALPASRLPTTLNHYAILKTANAIPQGNTASIKASA
jgi:hypothetical protein